ncbi:hypothetical protein CAP36_08770 [Chitinophagaceae bacterium IBVUCB2]|nr:hypothetical protein CAP36_08770 [Chitinophagaceae bacterium IBVUCB2]
MKALQKHHRILFYGLWLFLGLIQAGLTELQDDEAYYWVYSQYLDWGYFDHPPMIGLLVKMGYAIFPNELGVRFFPLLLNIFSFVIIEKLIDKKNPLLFYTILLSIAVLQLSGFAAVPDTPLIFFTALFFLCYKRFTANNSLLNTFLLGLAVALLLYSKYHAVLIVFFVLLSNLRLFTKYQTYLAGLIALLLFAPHLWWQYQHNWVSFRYHLFESNVNAYKFSFTTEYLLGQLLLAGPIAGFILLPAAFLYKPTTTTEKALRFSMLGIYVFFLLSSLRGKVEANWTSPALVAVIVLAHQYLQNQQTIFSRKGLKVLAGLLPITLLLITAVRIIMIADIVPVKAIEKRYHAWKEWPAVMKEKTKGLPVVFSNSYQRASKYWFYSGQITYSQNWLGEHRNNYNFWPVEDSLLGKSVYFMDVYQLYRFTDSLQTPIGWVGYQYDSSLASFAKIRIETAQQKMVVKKENQSVQLNCTFSIPKQYAAFISKNKNLADTVRAGIFNRERWIKDVYTDLNLQKILTRKTEIVSFDPQLQPGTYYFILGINSRHNNATHNSEKIKLIIE